MNRETTIKKRHSTNDLINQIKILAVNGSKNKIIQSFAEKIKHLPKEQKNKAILNFAYDNAVMELSPEDRQQLRTVENILRTGKANCTGYTTLISAICHALNEPHTYRLTDTGGNGYDHIYILKDNFVLDATAGQPADNTATKENRNFSCKFNFEFPYLQKKDFKMLTVVNGRTATTRKNVNGILSDIFSIGTTIWATSDQCKRDCDLKYPFDAEQRQFCKNACEMNATTTPTTTATAGSSSNTLMYVGIGAIALAGIYFATKK